MKFGILGDAKISREQLIPAMRAAGAQIIHLGRRDARKPSGDPLYDGVRQSSYEEMLADPEVEAVYNPLPNHLHVPWSIKALEAGKHVLCEKPMALNLAELDALEAAADKAGRYVYEAFMVRHHPQWEWLQSVDIGAPQMMSAHFSYPRPGSDNVRNVAAWGGGPVWDIGCYCLLAGMRIFKSRPRLIASDVAMAEGMDVEKTGTAMLDFGAGRYVNFMSSSGAALSQMVHLVGETGWARLDVPFNASGQTTAHWAKEALGVGDKITFPACNQYQNMVADFMNAVRAGSQSDFTDSRIMADILGTIVAGRPSD